MHDIVFAIRAFAILIFLIAAGGWLPIHLGWLNETQCYALTLDSCADADVENGVAAIFAGLVALLAFFTTSVTTKE